jgi:hypothetical protein
VISARTARPGATRRATTETRATQWGAYDNCWDKRGFIVTDTPFWGIDINDATLTEEEGIDCMNEQCPDCDIELAAQAM